jgi:peptidoglycan DL-endopeptidase CwlO
MAAKERRRYVKDLPHSRHVARRLSPSLRADRRISAWQRAAVLAGGTAICAALLSGGAADATPSSGGPGINAVVAKANALSAQIDVLGQQYDALQIQLQQARAAAAIARQDAARDQRILNRDQLAIGAIAVENYMTGGLSPTVQLLESSSPQSLLNRASIMTQIQQENGAKVRLVATAVTASERAQAAAAQEEQQARHLAAAMAAKVAQIQKRENFFNSRAFAQAESIFQQTGHYPRINVRGDTLGVEAVQEALDELGKPYEWGAAGPNAFDCSGLVVWAYGKLGISLEHYTGDLWNEGEHVSLSEIEPGDLVFFNNIGHVGIYIGNGYMVDAPTFGQVVQVQPISIDFPLDGVVRIIG